MMESGGGALTRSLVLGKTNDVDAGPKGHGLCRGSIHLDQAACATDSALRGKMLASS
jgi:hypothetical protein